MMMWLFLKKRGKLFKVNKCIFEKISAKEGGNCVFKLFDNLILELRKFNFENITNSHVLTKKHLIEKIRKKFFY